eukprot:6748791-Pyramimonas_sp.AAC.1
MGVIELDVLKEDVPPLLPVGFQEMLGARIDLSTNQIELERLGVKADVRRLPTGHRTMRLDDFGMPTPGAVFKCPPSVLSQHPEVEEQDFRSETMSRYIIVSSPSSSGP